MVGEQRNMAPSSIRFPQSSISEKFQSGETLDETFRQLVYEDTSVEEIGLLKVVLVEGVYWVVSGNRRLYLYRKLQEKERLSTVPVVVIGVNREKFDKMRTTTNNGTSVMIRQDCKRPYGNKLSDRLDNIYNQWKREQLPRSTRYAYDYTDSMRSSPMAHERPTPVFAAREYSTRSASSTYASAQQSPRPTPPPAPQARDDSWCTIL